MTKSEILANVCAEHFTAEEGQELVEALLALEKKKKGWAIQKAQLDLEQALEKEKNLEA